jgi:hypothetical protein
VPLLTEFIASFAYGLVAAVSEVCKIFWHRPGSQGDKRGHSLRGPCDRCPAIFIFRMPLDNSHYAVSDIAARDLISSYFRFPWELTLMDFRAFAQVPPPDVRLPIPATLLATPTGRCLPGVCCATDGGAATRFSANHVNASVPI